MISDARQYAVTLSAIARFEAALKRADRTNAHLDTVIQAAMKASIIDQLAALRQEVLEYEFSKGLIAGNTGRP